METPKYCNRLEFTQLAEKISLKQNHVDKQNAVMGLQNDATVVLICNT